MATRFFCSSIPAYESYKLLEPNSMIPSPDMRLNFIRDLYLGGMRIILTIRPLCPDEFISVAESVKLVNLIHGFCSAVISSGIVVNNEILNRLKTFPNEFEYSEKTIMHCLNNDLMVKYVDVEDELSIIKRACDEDGIPFFRSSLPALNYLASL